MVNSIQGNQAWSSDQMVQQTMRGRGFGRRRGPVEGEGGFTPPEGFAPRQGGFGPPPGLSEIEIPEGMEGAEGFAPQDRAARMQDFAARFKQRSEGGLPALGSFGGPRRSEGAGEAQLSASDGRVRGPRQRKENPQLAAAMEALRQVLDASLDGSEEEKQSNLINWAAQYQMPVPEPGSKWFWEI